MKRFLSIVFVIALAFFACAGIFLFYQNLYTPVQIYHVDASPSPVSLPQTSEEPAEISGLTERLNLNTATAEELMKLPGIGETLAKAIIEYREECDGFDSVKELTEVNGIGEKKYNAIKDYLLVDK